MNLEQMGSTPYNVSDVWHTTHVFNMACKDACERDCTPFQSRPGFIQFVADNADRNLANLDEKSKYHGIGMLVTKFKKFHGIGMLDATKFDKFCGIGMLDVTKFYLFIYFI